MKSGLKPPKREGHPMDDVDEAIAFLRELLRRDHRAVRRPVSDYLVEGALKHNTLRYLGRLPDFELRQLLRAVELGHTSVGRPTKNLH